MLTEGRTKERVSPQLCEVARGGLTGERQPSQADVARAASPSDKGHFPQRRRSLIFWLQTQGREKVARVAAVAVARGGEKVLNNMNMMKRSWLGSLFPLSHHVSSDKMLRHLCFTAFKRCCLLQRVDFKDSGAFPFSRRLHWNVSRSVMKGYCRHPQVQTLRKPQVTLVNAHSHA